jgi:hypothetical protein
LNLLNLNKINLNKIRNWKNQKPDKAILILIFKKIKQNSNHKLKPGKIIKINENHPELKDHTKPGIKTKAGEKNHMTKRMTVPNEPRPKLVHANTR